MSYIGKNPKVDSVKLEGSATAASGTEEGQLYYNTGAGSISKGLKVFKNNQFVAIDKQLGDADTFHLLKAADISTAEFSAARNSTSTSFLNQNAVPFETTTASGAAGTFSNSSTGDALLTDESADLVFAYKSSGTSDDAQEYFGIPLSIPKAFRGGNVVLSFEYRTGFGTGTTATVDGDFEVAVLDKSTGNGGQTTTTDTSGTAIAAGSNIAVASKTGLAVGQRIRLETGSSTIAAGSPDATVTEAFITSISTSTDHITISESYAPPSTSGGRITSGWLTDVVPGQLPAADSQTNKQGKKFSIQFKTEDDTSDIVLFFQNKNTSSTISRHLFVDNILLSANKFLQASSQTKTENYAVAGGQVMSDGDSTGTSAGYYVGSTTTPHVNTIDKLGTVINGNTTGFKFTANQNVIVNANFSSASSTLASWTMIIAGDESSITNADPGGTGFDAYRKASSLTGAGSPEHVSSEFELKKGEVVRFMSTTTTARYTANNIPCMSMSVRPNTSDVILLESQDEIFTDWIVYTPTITGGANGANTQWRYRLVGSEMEIQALYYHTSAGTADWSFSLPSGFTISTTAGPNSTDHLFAGLYIIDQSNAGNHGGCLLYLPGGTAIFRGNDQLYNSGGTFNPLAPVAGTAGAGGTNVFWSLNAKVPIQGRNTNFNPLLSLPLVDTGNQFESFLGYDVSGASTKSHRGKLDNITTNTINTLGTIDNSSTMGWSFQANQRVKCYFAFGMANGTGVAGICGVKFSQDPSTVADNALTSSHFDGLRVTGVQDTDGAGYQATASGNFIMEAGEFLQFGQEGSSFQNSNKAVVSLIVEKADDRKQLAHIIKPAVAVISNTQSSATYQEGQFGGSNAYVDRVLNTIKGESWFVDSLSSNVFTLQAGTYKVYASAPGYYINSNRIRLLNTTDSITQIQGQINYAASSYNGQSLAPLEGTFTITSAKSFKIQHINEFNYANDNALGNNSAAPSNGGESVFTRVTIEKLK